MKLKITATVFMAAMFAADLYAGAIFVSPTGSAAAAGTFEAPTTLKSAVAKVAAGDTIYLRGGSYVFDSQVTIDRTNSGAAGRLKCMFAWNAEKPVLDFSSEAYTSNTATNQRGIQINGHYWYLKGLEIKGAADNGIFIGGNNNIVELCILRGNRDSGLQISRYLSSVARTEWPSNNLVLNCESCDNWDKPPCGGENADGFACKLTSGPGNTFRGCWSHNNIDDGWDLYTKGETGAIDPVTIDQCVASANGTLTDGTTNENGDRNGFKLGGEDIAVAHVVTRSVAFKNGKNGFTWNSNPGAILLANSLAWDNAEGNYKFGDNSTTTQAVFTNNISFWTGAGAQSDKSVGTDVSNSNCWWDKSKSQPSINGKGLVVTAADFAGALGTLAVRRTSAGMLDFAVFKLAPGSDLINAGVVPSGTLPFVASAYYKGAPDLGAFEEGTATGVLCICKVDSRSVPVSVVVAGKTITFSTGAQGPAAVRLFDLSGVMVRAADRASGSYSVQMHTKGVSPGMYLYEIVVDNRVVSRDNIALR